MLSDSLLRVSYSTVIQLLSVRFFRQLSSQTVRAMFLF